MLLQYFYTFQVRNKVINVQQSQLRRCTRFLSAGILPQESTIYKGIYNTFYTQNQGLETNFKQPFL